MSEKFSVQNPSYETIDVQKKIVEFGQKIDKFAVDHDYVSLSTLLDEMEEFLHSNEFAATDAGLFYFLGTGFNIVADHIRSITSDENGRSDSFNDDVVKKKRIALYYFRQSLKFFEDYRRERIRRYADQAILYQRLLTNYANALDTIGRPIAALYYYRESLLSDPDFSMTVGNYGRSLSFLADLVNDSKESDDLHIHAYQAMKRAVTYPDREMTKEAFKAFSDSVKWYESYNDGKWVKSLNEPAKDKQYSLGRSNEERNYRYWCLENHLFLNPLNELIETKNSFAYDPLTIRSFTEDIDHKENNWTN